MDFRNSVKTKLNGAWGMTLVICLTIVLSSAVTATAAKLITGAQIKNGTITSADIRDGSIRAVDLAPGTATAGPVGAAGVQGAAGASGAAGVDGSARAFASVTPGAPPILNPGKVKGFVSVSQPSAGSYCLKLAPGIDRETTAPVAAVDFWTSPADVAFIQVHSASADCTATDEIQVVTRGNDGSTFVDNVGFHVLVP